MSTTMSWFKSRGGRSDSRSNSSPDHGSNRDRRDTDPQTCLEVFRNHWQQALNVIINKKDGSSGSMDDVNTVLHNFEHMVTLLVGEEGIDGMPGPILHFLLEKDIFEKFCLWTISTKEGLGKLRYEQLRMFELAINQSKQLLLIHKPVIRPLMKLLTSCTDPSIKSDDIEYRTVLVLHQICVCISQQTVILESFFNTNADHGPARFLIFSLLIPFIHREGPIGQNARDALLLIMALSAKHPHIGQYTADSDFCPVLATGLSGLYSSLPRKITPPSDDWYMLTDEDVARTPDLQMFLNSLEFCNAVVQIGHPVVKNQLIKYIYDGFLVPVLGPALHQNSREEVMTATAYLDLFLRRITEPVLIRAFLKFILLEKNDEIIILDSLVTRINSNSRLSLVSLALFKTLINLNCEDVMLQLVFKYLIPCTHVMVSQRRSVKDLDMYSKSAEKFLTLRPSCCTPKTSDSSPGGTNTREKTPPNSSLNARLGRTRSLLNSPPNTITKSNKPFRDLFSRPTKAQRSNSQLVTTTPPDALRRNSQTSPSSPDTKSEDYETSYFDYLHDARYRLTKCARACRNWTAPYNGETPPPDCFIQEKAEEVSPVSSTDVSTDSKDVKSPNVRLFSHGNVSSSSNPPAEVSINSSQSSEPATKLANHTAASEKLANHEKANEKLANKNAGSTELSDKEVVGEKLANHNAASEELANQDEAECNKDSHDETLNPSLSKMLSSLDSVESFLHYLEEIDSPQDVSTVSIEDNLNSLEMVLSNLSQSLNTSSVDTSSGQDSSKSGSIHGSRSNVEVPCSLNLSSYVEITLSSPDRSNAQKVLQELPQRSLLTSPDSTLSPSRWTDIELSFSVAGSPSASSASRSFSARYSNSPPNIGPFLAAVFSKLDSMMQNSLYMNLLLTGIVARLAAYPQPLLRSFLLNHNLVFQPTVKSLVQVLSSVRQKVDNYARTVSSFELLVLRARKNLVHREECFFSSGSSPVPASLAPSSHTKPVRAATIAEVPGKERRSPSQSLRDLLFRRSPAEKKGKLFGNKGTQLQRVPGGGGYLFINRDSDEQPDGPEQSLKTWNAVYCAIVLEEFLKELAALAQEHAVLSVDEGGIFRLDS